MRDSKAWLEKATQDFDTANFNLDNGRFSYAAFLYQQSVEKALKYASLKKRHKLPKIHDCFVLAKQLGAPDKVAEKCDLITPYYFRTRYPDVEEDVNEEEANQLKTAAKEVLAWVQKNF